MNIAFIARNAIREFFAPGFGLYDKLRARGLERRIALLQAENKLLWELNTKLQDSIRNRELHTD